MSDADDVVKTAGKLFGKLGGALRQAGGQAKEVAKQVSGLGRGDVKLELDHTRASPGGSLRGRVVLALSEPVAAKRLVATLRARQKIVTVGSSSSGKSVGSQHADVYSFDAELGGATTYESGSHAFELHVPSDALDLRAATAGINPLADAVRSVASALSPGAGPIEWEVVARLEDLVGPRSDEQRRRRDRALIAGDPYGGNTRRSAVAITLAVNTALRASVAGHDMPSGAPRWPTRSPSFAIHATERG